MSGLLVFSFLLRAYSILFDIVTFPLYFFLQQPWKVWEEQRRKKAVHLIPGDPSSPLVRSDKDGRTLDDSEEVTTSWYLFEEAVKRLKNRRLLGTRPIISEEITQNKMRKVELGEPTWMSYHEVHKQVKIIAKALVKIGVQPKQPINILSETRAEWLMTLLACGYVNVPIATLYATLGIDGIVHGLNETEVEIVFTSSDLLPKVHSALLQAPKVKKIIYFEGFSKPDTSMFSPDVQVLSFTEFLQIGRESEEMKFNDRAKRDDIVIIMYTSGSTGLPKAVEIKHGVIGLMVQEYALLGIRRDEEAMHVAYLPLAHLYELGMESLMIWIGIPIGYSSTLTLTNQSPGLKAGCKGDVAVYKPTFVATVPLVLDRIRKGITNNVESKGPYAVALFEYMVNYKIWWYRKGFETPILNTLIFKSMKKILGGKGEVILSAGAPLSADTEEFIKATMCVDLCQAYGMTETCASGTCSLIDNRISGNIGPPNRFCYIKFRDWEEGNYRVTDKPNPRGEVLIGGKNSMGKYFKRDELNEDAFKTIDGIHYCLTGDIGEILPDGCLKIIDRKKDLVKLMFGEYISLGKVESVLKTASLVDNACVYGHGLAKFLVVLISPNRTHLNLIAQTLGKENLSFEDQCNDVDLVSVCFKELKDHCVKSKLHRNEIPQKIKLCSEPWTTQTGLVTAAFKIKRRAIQDTYQTDIDKLYGQL